MSPMKPKKITNKQLNQIVMMEYRKRENMQINEGLIGDILGKIAGFLQAMTKSVAVNTRESTTKNLKATKSSFQQSNLTKEGMKDMADAYKESVALVQDEYKYQMKQVLEVLSKSEDKDIQQNLKGYASNIVMTCMGDVASIVEGKSEIEDLINALQSGNIDTQADANATPDSDTANNGNDNQTANKPQ